MPYEAPPTRLALGISLTLLASFLFAIASAFVWLFRGKFDTIQIVFFQNLISLICILPIALRRGHHRIPSNYMRTHMARDVMGVTSYYLFFLAIRFLDLPDATVLYNSSPFFVPLIWWFWKRERIAPHLWGAIIIGFVGVAVLMGASTGMFQAGFVFGVLAAIASAIALCALRILNLYEEPMTRTLFYYFVVGTLLTSPLAAAVWVDPTPTEWLYAIIIGVSTAVGQVLLTIAYRYGTASYLSPLSYTSIIYAALIAWIFFGEDLTSRFFIGAVLIVLGGTTTYLIKKKPTSIKTAFESPKQPKQPPF